MKYIQLLTTVIVIILKVDYKPHNLRHQSQAALNLLSKWANSLALSVSTLLTTNHKGKALYVGLVQMSLIHFGPL